MNNPFNYFKKFAIDFQVCRNSQIISTLKGLKNTEQGSGKKYIGFDPGTDVQIGDILINSNINYYVIDVDTSTWQGEISSVNAYYQTTPPINSQTNSTVYNIQSASNSIIGSQQSAIINNSSFNIDDLKELIELYGANDKHQLYELTSILKQSLDNDDFHKSKLSKFGDLIAKHSWLPLSIAQIISAYLQSH